MVDDLWGATLGGDEVAGQESGFVDGMTLPMEMGSGRDRRKYPVRRRLQRETSPLRKFRPG